MDNVPPSPPALVAQNAEAQQLLNDLARMGGIVIYRPSAHTDVVRVIGACWDDLAGPIGWNEVPMVPDLAGCYRPDLRRLDGQEWQKRLNAAVFRLVPTPTPVNTEYAGR